MTGESDLETKNLATLLRLTAFISPANAEIRALHKQVGQEEPPESARHQYITYKTWIFMPFYSLLI